MCVSDLRRGAHRTRTGHVVKGLVLLGGGGQYGEVNEAQV